ncbi:5-methyltetrahydropteroyltriglutamate-homocysteine methyltransferase [Methanoculleus bourgensis]|jgi:5-methyltetrahydropteroyltriglutamate--homocysteine methyltransferase|uniref:Putative methylcobalamin:homocysteine methyltransferase n=1 Tax=Methanoculleus bourgensis TaxID=83986 RepID=A0A0X3BN32_9EURY|nr:methionine synthase [Methanoculleus bourgensis]CVK32945.1 putative methylcobalamin:homocysteine methyltransferase [Methanoculleus bourgensis]SAI89042.1 5-methyltetrahydropteroyltriglutamate-homocysteine methyltransferase [Methanoculleus bourgensis]
MRLMSRLLPTTVVGSYPVVKGSGIFSLVDPLKHAVEVAVADQVAAGIDIISDGQVRGDMIRAFTSRLPGIRGSSVVGKVQPARQPITVGDTKYALSRHPKVKGILTGPSTLAHGLAIETPFYRNKDELVLDLAQALAVEAAYLESAGVTVLQVDEPIFSTGAANIAVGLEAVNAIVARLRIPVCLHVCGGLSAVIDDVLQANVAIFDFEFANNPGNLDLLSEKDLRGRMIGYGCVDSADPAVESVETIRKRIEAGVDVFSPEAMLIDPDCGLRMQSRDAAFGKLKNMVAAAGMVRAGYTG